MAWRWGSGISRRSRKARATRRRRSTGSALYCWVALRICWRWAGVRCSIASLRARSRRRCSSGMLLSWVRRSRRRCWACAGSWRKPGSFCECALLLLGREVAVAVHPLGEMLLIRLGAGTRFGLTGWIGFWRGTRARRRKRRPAWGAAE